MHSKSETVNDFASGSVVRNLKTCVRIDQKEEVFLVKARTRNAGTRPKDRQGGELGRRGGSLGGEGADRGKK